MEDSREETVVFVDTSIEIGRQVHAPEIQQSIRQRLREFTAITTGLQVRNEFKRRFLGEAQYLLGQLESKKSYQKARRHIESNLQTTRKRNICLATLSTIFEQAQHGTRTADGVDAELTERAKLFLRDLLRFGMDTFDGRMHKIFTESQCVCASEPIKEKKPFISYDFGVKKCSKAGSRCKIGEFLTANLETLRKIADHLSILAAPAKTDELVAAERFIREFISDPTDVQSKNPCDAIGDLIIALESQTVRNFYTMNVKESEHLCKALDQRLIYRHPNPIHGEQEFPAAGEANPSPPAR